MSGLSRFPIPVPGSPFPVPVPRSRQLTSRPNRATVWGSRLPHMANIGQTLFRFTGALLLAAGATAVDNPRVMADATKLRSVEAPVFVAQSVGITPGKRAFAIRITDMRGIVSAVTKPNARVDILVTPSQTEGEPTQGIAKIVLSNVRVLAIGVLRHRTTSPPPPASGYVVTVEVTPEEAEQLALAGSRGALSVTLRGDGDASGITTRGRLRRP